MQVQVVQIDREDGVVALVATEFKDQFPRIHDPVNIAELLDYIANGGTLGDEEITSLTVAAAVVRNVSDLFFSMPSNITQVTLGDPEVVEEVGTPPVTTTE